MSFLNRKIKQIEENMTDENITNFSKATSDKTVDIIKALSGKGLSNDKKLIDNVVLFTNASGGAGATTLVNNIAYEALQKNLKVVIVDLHILCPVQHTYLGIQQTLECDDLVSFLLGRSDLSSSINISNSINLIYANNRNLNDQLNCNSKTAISNFNEMIDRLRQYYDLVLIDCPMRIDDMLPNVAMYKADTIYLVWDEGIASTINTEKIRRNLGNSGIDSFTKMKVILNKRTDIHFSDYALNKLSIELIEVLPFTTDIIDNSLRGKIFCEGGYASNPNSSEFARKISVLTDKIVKAAGYIE